MEEHDLGSEPEKKGGPARHRGRHASGGTTHKIQEYNAQGSNEVDEAKDTTPAFNKGGKRKAGGVAPGAVSASRADRPSRARGGEVKRDGLARGGVPKTPPAPRKLARGGASNPYSSGRNLQELDNSKPGKGYELISVPSED